MLSTYKTISSRAYSARKSALYDNCILQAPDGQQLCTCDYKKAMWLELIKDRIHKSNKNNGHSIHFVFFVLGTLRKVVEK